MAQRWSQKEAWKLLSAKDVDRAVALLPGRGRQSIIQRRWKSGVPWPVPNLKERFLAMIKKEDGCWLWTGAVFQSTGYGDADLVGADRTLAHRLSYKIFVGEIPDDLLVLHRCDIRLCVKPRHLFLGTQADNIRDMDQKGRRGFPANSDHLPRGDNHHGRKIREADVPVIREMIKNGQSRNSTANVFGVSRQAITSILNGETWKHVAVVALVLLSGCSSVPPRATRNGSILPIWSGISTKEFIRVRGMGAVQPGTVGQVARRGSSRNAALVGARYQLLALVQGVKLEGGVTMAMLMEKDSLIREIANEIVAGGEEVLVEWLPDDAAVVTLELKRSKVERLIQQKSEREKKLERRVALLSRSISTFHSGWASNRRNYDREWRQVRAMAMWGRNRWPFTWLAGGGDYDCWNPFTRCYWTRMEKESEYGDQLDFITGVDHRSEFAELRDSWRKKATKPTTDAKIATVGSGKKD